jgi:hypothetical protein
MTAIFQEGIMTKFVSFLAVALMLSISSVEAAKKKPQVAAANSAPVRIVAHPKRGNAAWLPTGSGCKMKGTC